VAFDYDVLKFFKSPLFIFVSILFGPIAVIVYFITYFDLIQLHWVIARWVDYSGGGLRLQFTLPEPNIYGAVLVPILLAMLSIKYEVPRIVWWIIVLGLHIGLVLSFSRGPWLAYIISLLVYFLVRRNKRYDIESIFKLIVVLFFLIIISSFAIFALLNLARDVEIIARIDSISTRLLMWGLAVENIFENFLIGNGVLTFSALEEGASTLVGSDTYRSVWVSNISLLVLHDTGVIGFVLFNMFLLNVYVKSMKGIRFAAIQSKYRHTDNDIRAAIFAGGLSLIITGQTIPTLMLALFWVYVALAERTTLRNYIYKIKV